MTDSFALNLIQVLVAVLIAFISYSKWKLSYWKRTGLPHLNPKIPFGDTTKLFMKQYSFGEQFQDFYNQFKSRNLRHGGIYLGLSPHYVPVDLKIIKHIMQLDFPHFVNHGIYVNKKDDPLTGHLFSLEDAEWKNMRAKLTPTFTSGKMKMMFHTLVECTTQLKHVMDDYAINGISVDIKDILARFTTDIIGSAAFGLECNSLKDPNGEFRRYGRKVFELNSWDRLKGILQFTVPHSLLKVFKMKLTKPDVENFFMKIIENTVKYRETNNIYRKDFMHLLLQLKNRGMITDDEKITDSDGSFSEKALTMNELAAQAFVFFIAGFETSSTTMTFAIYELASNPDIQRKLREEINTVLAKYDNKLTYEGVMEMDYMQKVLEETLRKYPPAPLLSRVCNKNYIIPNTNVCIEEGTYVQIPILGVHHDPEYYPDPEKFDPERFSEDNKRKRPPFTWMPFGEGPRICIGLRFGILQSKVGLTALLKNYHLTLNKKTKTPLTMEKLDFITTAQGGIWIDVEKIQ